MVPWSLSALHHLLIITFSSLTFLHHQYRSVPIAPAKTRQRRSIALKHRRLHPNTRLISRQGPGTDDLLNDHAPVTGLPDGTLVPVCSCAWCRACRLGLTDTFWASTQKYRSVPITPASRRALPLPRVEGRGGFQERSTDLDARDRLDTGLEAALLEKRTPPPTDVEDPRDEGLDSKQMVGDVKDCEEPPSQRKRFWS